MNINGKKSVFRSIWRSIHANPVIAARVDVLSGDRSVWRWEGEFGGEDADESIPIAGEVGVRRTVQEGNLVDLSAKLCRR
jgi:hypothetical protein